MSGRLPATSSGYTQAWARARDASHRYRQYTKEIFRAKRGFTLEAHVLPTKPLQTASAATPLPPRRKASRPDPQKTAQAAPLRSPPPEQQAPVSIPAPPARAHSEKRARKQAVAHGERSIDNKPPPPMVRWKRGRRHALMMQSGLFIGIFTAMLAFAAGAGWWMESTGKGTMMSTNAMSSPVARNQSVAAKSAQPGAVKPRNNRGADGPIGIAHTPASAGRQPPPVAENQVRTEQTRQMTTPELQAGPAADSIPARASPAPGETADTPTPVLREKKPAEAGDKKPRSPPRKATASKSERAEEINRLRSQAFSETRKDRLGAARPREKAPAPESDLDRSSARKTGLLHAFNQCKRKESFLEQEQCKWQICAGKWGQNGCPAYKHDVASY